MGVMVGFAIGYVLGTRAGEEGYREMTSALRTITSSGELKELLGGVVSVLADMVKEGAGSLGDGAEGKLRRIA